MRALAIIFPRNFVFDFTLFTTAALVFLARGTGNKPHLENTYWFPVSTPTIENEHHYEKTCLWGLQPGKTKTGLLSYTDKLES